MMLYSYFAVFEEPLGAGRRDVCSNRKKKCNELKLDMSDVTTSDVVLFGPGLAGSAWLCVCEAPNSGR